MSPSSLGDKKLESSILYRFFTAKYTVFLLVTRGRTILQSYRIIILHNTIENK